MMYPDTNLFVSTLKTCCALALKMVSCLLDRTSFYTLQLYVTDTFHSVLVQQQMHTHAVMDR